MEYHPPRSPRHAAAILSIMRPGEAYALNPNVSEVVALPVACAGQGALVAEDSGPDPVVGFVPP